MIQIGATRVASGRLLRQECLEHRFDPQRHVPAAGIPTHGIRPDMQQGQPAIDTVPPALHTFARDTLLAAHNPAFAMAAAAAAGRGHPHAGPDVRGGAEDLLRARAEY